MPFWRSTPKAPVTEADREWTEEAICWLAEEFGIQYFKGLRTFRPTPQDFGHRFTAKEADAEFVLRHVCGTMDINRNLIDLRFYSEEPLEFSEGLVTTPSDKLDGSWTGSAGRFTESDTGKAVISIEMGQLRNPESLIATMAHELAHVKLLGEARISENDEPLTDLTAIGFGYGIFQGNSAFEFSQWTGSSHQGWRMNRLGYLPEQMIAYALACLTIFREENDQWQEHLKPGIRKYYERSKRYILANRELVRLPGIGPGPGITKGY